MKHTDLAILSLGLLLVISSFKSSSEARSVNLAPPQCHPNVIGNCNKKNAIIAIKEAIIAIKMQ